VPRARRTRHDPERRIKPPDVQLFNRPPPGPTNTCALHTPSPHASPSPQPLCASIPRRPRSLARQSTIGVLDFTPPSTAPHHQVPIGLAPRSGFVQQESIQPGPVERPASLDPCCHGASSDRLLIVRPLELHIDGTMVETLAPIARASRTPERRCARATARGGKRTLIST
jgi:hypothetical protein